MADATPENNAFSGQQRAATIHTIISISDETSECHMRSGLRKRRRRKKETIKKYP